MSLKIKGLEAAMKAANNLTHEIQDQRKPLRKIGFMIVDAAKQNVMTMAAHQSNLASRIDCKVETNTSAVVGYMGAGHAPFFEFGTGIAGKEGQALDAGFGNPEIVKIPAGYEPSGQPIKPKHGKFLIWKDRETGETVFARQTRGQMPHPALRKAVSDHVNEFVNILAKENADIISKVAI